MALTIGDTAPDFEAETTEGRIRFHDWLGDSWGVLFSHPKDFTPVCTTELGYMAGLNPELRNQHEAPRFHHAARPRCGRVAARGARAAGRAVAAHRGLHGPR